VTTSFWFILGLTHLDDELGKRELYHYGLVTTTAL